MNSQQQERVFTALDSFAIEVPSWGFANTGTRFGKFVQAAAATNTEEKMSDAGQVHAHTGCCPSVAVHVLWDFPEGAASAPEVARLAEKYGVRVGSINPNVFQDQIYKHGSLGNPDPAVREAALSHILDSVEIGAQTGSQDISLWFADGSNYPGTANIRRRRAWFEEGLRAAHARLRTAQRLLVEYKPFEPAFYHTDIADWGMALALARAAGPQAKVLVDTGHHYQAQNIEQIVAWLLADNMLGGFHFNDRRYADDDLTLGSIDPYQVFRIFHEIYLYQWETGREPLIAYMIDQSHNLKPKIEAMIQSAITAQELYAKAALVDRETLAGHQDRAELVDAEECLKSAFQTDVRPVIEDWRRSKGLAASPLTSFRESGYGARAT
ncbi:MAG: sugar isomerase, partial [bacterium]|nr:sugar isomerase [bacterium]